MNAMFGTDYLNIRAWDLSIIRRGRYGQLVWGKGAMPDLGALTGYNIAIGTEALRDAVDTNATVAIGWHAGASDSNGRTGVYIGHVAGEFVSGPNVSSNTFIGGYCGRGVESDPMSGGDNTGVGEACMLNLRGASYFNTGMGFNCFYGLREAIGNTGYGNSAGLTLVDTDGNCLFGVNAYQWGGGSYNLIAGYTAGEGYTFTKTTTASGPTTPSGGTTIYFANTSDLSVGMMLYSGGAIEVGSVILSIDPNVSVTIDQPTFNAIANGATITVVPNRHTGARNVFLGYLAGNQISGALDDTTGVGYGALRNLTTGGGNTSLGSYTGHSLTTQTENTFIGYRSGRYITSNSNTFVGYAAGRGVSGTLLTGDGNVGIGQDALADIQGAATRNTGLGTAVGLNITTGSYNVLLGANVAAVLTTGSSNIIIGYDLEVAAAGTSNTLNIGGLITGTGTYGTGTQSLAFAGAVTMPEQADAAAPAANFGTFYMRDNGAGKTQFVVRFPTGAIQVLATEP